MCGIPWGGPFGTPVHPPGEDIEGGTLTKYHGVENPKAQQGLDDACTVKHALLGHKGHRTKPSGPALLLAGTLCTLSGGGLVVCIQADLMCASFEILWAKNGFFKILQCLLTQLVLQLASQCEHFFLGEGSLRTRLAPILFGPLPPGLPHFPCRLLLLKIAHFCNK